MAQRLTIVTTSQASEQDPGRDQIIDTPRRRPTACLSIGDRINRTVDFIEAKGAIEALSRYRDLVDGNVMFGASDEYRRRFLGELEGKLQVWQEQIECSQSTEEPHRFSMKEWPNVEEYQRLIASVPKQEPTNYTL